jgi:hypothetical protein
MFKGLILYTPGVHTLIFNIPHIQGYYTSLSFLRYLNISSIQKNSIGTLHFLIYHFYVYKCSIYANNMRYIDSNEFFHKTHFEISSIN